MGLAFKAPAADRRRERDRLAIEDQLPANRADWRYDFSAAAAKTFVGGCREFD